MGSSTPGCVVGNIQKMSDEEDDVPFEYAHPEPVQGHTPMYDDVSEDESHSVEQHDDEDVNVPEYEKLEYPKRPIQVVTRVRPLLKRVRLAVLFIVVWVIRVIITQKNSISLLIFIPSSGCRRGTPTVRGGP